MTKLRVGDPAPGFTLPNQRGEDVSLKDFLGKSNVVLYFYPKDFTMGCTAETMRFTEDYNDLKRLGAEVVGVSSDSVASHGQFAEHCNAPFPLLSDEGGRVRAEYGVRPSLGLIPGRVTYLIDKTGLVRHIFSSQLNPKKHVREAVEVLKSLSDG